jgi:hypothetical protein
MKLFAKLLLVSGIIFTGHLNMYSQVENTYYLTFSTHDCDYDQNGWPCRSASRESNVYVFRQGISGGYHTDVSFSNDISKNITLSGTITSFRAWGRVYKGSDEFFNYYTDLSYVKGQYAFMLDYYYKASKCNRKLKAKIDITVDDPVYLNTGSSTINTYVGSTSTFNYGNFHDNGNALPKLKYCVAYKYGSYNEVTSVAPSGGNITQTAASIIPDCSYLYDKDIYFRIEKTLENGTVTYGNIIGPYRFYDIPTIKVANNSSAVVCAGNTIKFKGGYINYPDCNPNAVLEVNYNGTWKQLNIALGSETELSYADICGTDNQWQGKEIQIRPYKMFQGVRKEGTPIKVVFLPVIKNIDITPHAPNCAGGDDGNFTLTFTDVPVTGCKNEKGGSVPLLITIEQYTEYPLAPVDESTYKRTYEFDINKPYYYFNGASILKNWDLTDKNWITIDNSILSSGFKLHSGKYKIYVQLNNGAATCGATITKDFVTPAPLKISAAAKSILSKDGTTYHVKTGETSAQVKFTFEGGTPPYVVRETDANGKALASYDAAGEYYLDVTTDAVNETKRTYYISDKHTCPGSGTQNVSFFRPADLTFSGLSSTPVDCNQSDATGAKSNGTVSATISGGVSEYTVELWSGTDSLKSKTVLAAGKVTFTNEDYPITPRTYQIKVKDKLNSGKTWPSGDIPVGVPDALTITAVPTDPSCNYLDNGSLTLTGGGGNGNYFYSVTKGGSNISNYSGTLSDGVYLITVTDGKLCTQSTSSTLYDPAILGLTATYTKPASCSMVDNGMVRAEVNNYRSSVTDVSFTDSKGNKLTSVYSGTGNVFTITGLSDTSRMEIYVNDKYCSTNDSVKIPIRTFPFSIETGVTSEAPCTGKNGVINVTAVNGEIPTGTNYKYSVDGGTPIEHANTSQTFTLAGNTSHSFKIVDGVGCIVIKGELMRVKNDSLRLNKIPAVKDSWCTESNTGEITIAKSSGVGAIDFQISPTKLVKQGDTQVTFYDLYPKTYTILATDINGCTDVVEVPIKVRIDSLNLTSFNAVKAVCKESSPTGTLKVSRYVSGAKTGFEAINYTLNQKTQADTTFSGLRSGWYTITATDSKGCSVNISDSVKFEENPVRLDTLWVIHQTCNEVQNAKIKLAASTKSGTQPLYRFVYGQDTTAWRSDTITYPLNLAGNYTFKVIDKNNCGTSRTETIKNLKYAPKPMLEYSSPVACANAENGELKVFSLANHSQPKYRYSLGSKIFYTTSSNQHVTYSGLKKGYHIINIRDTLGCQDTARFLVKVESDSVHISSIKTTPATCIVAQNGKVQIVASSFDKNSTTNKYTFECNQKTLYGDSVIFSGMPVNKTGLYLVKVTDRYGCKNTGNFAINVQNDTLNLEFRNLEDAACPGSSDGWMKLRRRFGNEKFRYNVFSEKGYSRIFEMNDTLVPVNNLPFGIYTVTVKDTNNCVARVENIKINQPDTIRFLSFYNNYVKRKGEPEGILSASIWKGNGKYNYEWYNLDKNSLVTKGQTLENAKIKIANLYAGNYLLKVQDTANCFVSPGGWLEKRFTLVEPEKALELNIVSNKPVSCYGMVDGEFRVKANGGWGDDYLYGLDAEHLDISGLFTGHAAGTLSAFVKDTSGVVVTIPITITQPDPLTVSYSQKTDANCFGSSDGSIKVNISGGNYPHYFVSDDNVLWMKGNILSGLPKGNYTLYVRDTLNCRTKLQNIVAIDQPSEINVLNSKITDTRCMFANGAITAEIGGGIPNYMFSWYDENNKKLLSNESNAANLYSGTYRLNVVDSHNCLKVFPFNVSDITDLTIDRVDTISVSCWGYKDGKASISISKGNPPYTISWPDSTHNTSVTGLQSGVYTVRVDDKERCKVFRNFSIGTPSRIMLESKTIISPYCEGVEDGKIAVNGIGSFGGYNYLWDNGKEGNSISKLSPGIYELTITDSHNCFNKFDFDLDYQHTIKPNLGYDRNLCNGNSLILTPGDYIKYKWGSNNGLNSIEPEISVSNAGRYFVQITDNENCIGRDTINIGVSSTEMEGRVLAATYVEQNDTVVLFQASWPLPDSVKFNLEGCRIIETGQYFRKVVYSDTGTYTLALTSYLNDCEDIVKKVINVGAKETKLKKSMSRLIQSFRVSPNPNNGTFNVEIQLQEPEDIQLRLVNLGTGVISDIRTYKDLETYYLPYNLNLPSGTYMLHLQCRKDARSQTLIIIK